MIDSTSACVTTSWDDGHPLDLKVTELLAKYGVPGTFYVPRRSSKEVLTGIQIRQISQAFELGAHTLNHVDLTTVADEDARREISESTDWLQNLSGKPCPMFCFPRGRYRKRHFPMVAEAGCIAARTVQMMSLDFPQRHGGIRLMPTTVQAFPHSRMDYVKTALKSVSVQGLARSFTLAQVHDWTTVARILLHRVACSGGVFHLWGHSWEIEEHNQWDGLDRVLAAMGEYKKRAQYLTNSEVCAHAG